MNKNLTELVIVSDRSGSMTTSRLEAQGAINRFLKDQKEEDGQCNVTFVEFDDNYDVLADGKPIAEVGEYELVPRGWTALYDAIGKAITTVGERLAKLSETDRPGLVTVMISTDGAENSSKEYSYQQVADMIKTQKETYSWQFVFLGVELDERIGTALNIDISNVVNLKRSKSSHAYSNTSDKLKAARRAVSQGFTASSRAVCDAMAYSDQEKADLGSDD